MALPNLFTPQPGDINTTGIELEEMVGTIYGPALVHRVNGSSVFTETNDGLLAVFCATAVTPLNPLPEPGDMLTPEREDEIEWLELGDAVRVIGGEVEHYGFVVGVDLETQYADVHFCDGFSRIWRTWPFPAERLEKLDADAAAAAFANAEAAA